VGKHHLHPEGPRKVEKMSDKREARKRAKERKQGGFIISSNLLLRHLPMAEKMHARKCSRARTHTHTTQGRKMAVLCTRPRGGQRTRSFALSWPI
jgi:hypothetical protein